MEIDRKRSFYCENIILESFLFTFYYAFLFILIVKNQRKYRKKGEKEKKERIFRKNTVRLQILVIFGSAIFFPLCVFPKKRVHRYLLHSRSSYPDGYPSKKSSG